MRALVTGGAGFIGSTLVDRLLAEGHEVDVVDDLSTGSLANLADARAARTGRLHIHQLDVRDPSLGDLVARVAPTVVFHLATRDGATVVEDAEVTVVGGVRLVEAARAAGAQKVVVASTAAIYRPPEPSELPIRESHPQQPVDPHGVAATSLVAYLTAYRELHELEFTALALSHVYGPRARSGPVAAEIAGDDVAVPSSTDLVFVDDAVDAFVRAATRGSGLVVNVGSGRETTTAELRDAVASATGRAPRRRRPRPRVGQPDRLALDIGRARIHLGWSPWTSLEEGVRLTVAAQGA
ncbi:NAD-dependent epimerase/dehydratase family protein [Actinomarinicola tropica]|uniref:NAD-dependent epimerase/dehydratase family protein n=1 Tax=Actinomarinicola tropica TaxID=2789776 RepID=A0A5Q2RLM1_9ACTN|nr:NAD-dependent epimerase/dehydratase family protein [Actinomarinicola tropica]QGG95822.1 NAD-dependent epimerase/dehydratase family protein [Actinomarinicola tropica]